MVGSTENKIINEDIDLIVASDLDWDQLRDKTILVTGGAGFLASYIIKSLIKANEVNNLRLKVICLVRNLNNLDRLNHLRDNSNLSIIKHDVTNPDFKSLTRSDFVIHSASNASPKYFGVDPVGTLLANSFGTQNMLDYSLKSKAHKFLFFSSSEVYGDPVNKVDLIKEVDYGYLDPMQVRSCYAESKRVGETMCSAWSSQHGLHTSVVRPFHTYGPSMLLDDGRVFADLVSNVLNEKQITLKSDGSSIRAFCYVRDSIEGIFRVLFNGKNSEAYNVGNPSQEISMKDLALTLCRIFPEKNLTLEFDLDLDNTKYIKSEVNRSSPDITKVRSLGWNPQVNIEDGFKRTVLSYE